MGVTWRMCIGVGFVGPRGLPAVYSGMVFKASWPGTDPFELLCKL